MYMSSSQSSSAAATDAPTLDLVVQNLAGVSLHVQLPVDATPLHLKQRIHAHKQWLSHFSACACAGCELLPDRQRLAVHTVSTDSQTSTELQPHRDDPPHATLDDARPLASQGVVSGSTVHVFVAAPAWRAIIDEYASGRYALDALEQRYGGEAACAALWGAAYVHAQCHCDNDGAADAPLWQCVVGTCHGAPRGGAPQDYALAAHWYERAATAGLACAQSALAMCCMQGRGVAEDEARAVHLWELAAAQGHVGAQFNVARCYLQGMGVAPDTQRAVHWWQQAAALGDARSAYSLGVCFRDGVGVERDVPHAMRLFEQASERGDARAAFNLGVLHQQGGDAERAVRAYQVAVDAGVADAQRNLGACYAHGIGVARDTEHAVRLFELAASQGDAQAQYNLGACCADGTGVALDAQRAAHWWLQAAAQGHAAAQLCAGVCFYRGTGVAQDAKRAAHMYSLAAAQGMPVAQFSLACCYRDGTGVAPDRARAIELLRAAAAHGFDDAQRVLDEMSGDGDGDDQDGDDQDGDARAPAVDTPTIELCIQNVAGAVLNVQLPASATTLHLKQHVHAHKQWHSEFTACACAGCELTPDRQRLAVLRADLPAASDAPASGDEHVVLCDARSLAAQGVAAGTTVHLFVTEPVWRVLVDDFLSVKYVHAELERRHGGAAACAPLWRAALEHAQHNRADAQWQCVMGACYDYGVGGVEQDHSLAVQHYQRAADLGLAKAQYNLACCYREGEGVAQSDERALQLWQLVADQGYAMAIHNVGVCFFQGTGVPRDEVRAVELWHRAAEQGHAKAQDSLGSCYQQGTGVLKDEARAVDLFQRAADQGNVCALKRLGMCYQNGTGVAPDSTRAAQLCQLAADLGDAFFDVFYWK